MSGPPVAVVGDFDGVHLGHRAALDAARRPGRALVAVVAEASRERRLTTVERRLDLLRAAGADDAVAAVTPPEGADAVELPPAAARTAEQIRAHLEAGLVEEAAALLGRPPELEGTVVSGDARGTGLGFPTANLALPAELLVPALGIYAGAAGGHRAAISVGTNPTYGTNELRVEAFLLDFSGDLYGRRLVLQLWRRLRDERAFASERELVDQIARDVRDTRAATPPA